MIQYRADSNFRNNQIVNNKSLLEYSLNAFKDFKNIKKTIIVYNKKHKKYFKLKSNPFLLMNAILIIVSIVRSTSI